MTNVTIPALPAGTAPTSASPVESVESGVSVRYTAAQLVAAGGSDVVQNVNGTVRIRIKNADPGNAANTSVILDNGTTFGGLQYNGIGMPSAGNLSVMSASGTSFLIAGIERVYIDGAGRVLVHALLNAANDAAAAGLGVPVDGLYRNGSAVMVRVV